MRHRPRSKKSKVPWTSQLISHSKRQEILADYLLLSNGFAATNNIRLNPPLLIEPCLRFMKLWPTKMSLVPFGTDDRSWLIMYQSHQRTTSWCEDTKDIGNWRRRPCLAQKCESCERWWYHLTVIPNPILGVPIHDLANVCGSYKRNHGWSTLQMHLLDHQPRAQSVPMSSFVPKWNSLIKKNNE